MTRKETGKTNEAEATPASTEAEKDKQEPRQQAVKAKHFRKKAQEEIGKNFHSIVKKLAKKAAGGSVPHTRLLFDLGGVKEEVSAAAPKKRQRRPPSLGKLLLDEVAKKKREKEKASQANGNEDPLE